ncbi:hypothetical protein DYB32_000630 [Aphanomyces invadans]|uniref:PX domain-containing protein n=1 Tax=Aphanomyces invadans TaxID=157072 RepID=A0A3R6W456_9STRA|nr:hypothetical protein DYB32_000630 [Aphanomyces invadans]
MGQVVSCCLGTEDTDPSATLKRKRQDDDAADVPSTPSMSDSLFYQSLGEHELYGSESSRVSTDGDLVETLLTKKRTNTVDSGTAMTPRAPYMSRFIDAIVATPRLPPCTTVAPTARTVHNTVRASGIPTLSYADDADDEGPEHTATASSVGTDDTFEEPQPAQDDIPSSDATSSVDDGDNNAMAADALTITTRTMHSFSTSSNQSFDSNDQDEAQASSIASPIPYAVAVKRFFPIEDKFEFSISVFHDDLGVGRQFDIIRDRIQVAKFHDALETLATSLGVASPSLPYTKKQNRQQGRALMDEYVQAIMQTPELRNARIALKYFHVVKATTPSAKSKKATSAIKLPPMTRQFSGGRKAAPETRA